MIDSFVVPLLKIIIVLNATLVGVTYMVLLERKVIAWAQSRLGPMRVGPYGILQPVADAVKLMIKEDITPVRADKWVFTVAPIILGAGRASFSLPPIDRADEALRLPVRSIQLDGDLLLDCDLSAQRVPVGRANRST